MKTLKKYILSITAIGGFFTVKKRQNSIINNGSKVSEAGFMEREVPLKDKPFQFPVSVARLPEIKGKLISLYLIFFELFSAIYK